MMRKPSLIIGLSVLLMRTVALNTSAGILMMSTTVKVFFTAESMMRVAVLIIRVPVPVIGMAAPALSVLVSMMQILAVLVLVGDRRVTVLVCVGADGDWNGDVGVVVVVVGVRVRVVDGAVNVRVPMTLAGVKPDTAG